MEQIGNFVVGSSLLANSIMDLRKRRILLPLTVVCGIFGLALRIWEDGVGVSLFLPLIPGLFFLLFAFLSREKVGYGDGILLLAIGGYFHGEELLTLCMTAVFAAGIAGLVLCVFFHKGKDYEIPFVPFLFFGYLAARYFT